MRVVAPEEPVHHLIEVVLGEIFVLGNRGADIGAHAVPKPQLGALGPVGIERLARGVDDGEPWFAPRRVGFRRRVRVVVALVDRLGPVNSGIDDGRRSEVRRVGSDISRVHE